MSDSLFGEFKRQTSLLISGKKSKYYKKKSGHQKAIQDSIKVQKELRKLIKQHHKIK